MTTVIPLFERVLLRVKTSEERTKGGLIIPVKLQEKTQEGIIMQVSEDESLFKVNDSVIYDKYAGIPIKVDDVDCILMRRDDILAFVKQEEDVVVSLKE